MCPGSRAWTYRPRGLRAPSAVRRGQRERSVNVSAHQLIAIVAPMLAIVAMLPVPNIGPYWTLAVAVLLLALLQFL